MFTRNEGVASVIQRGLDHDEASLFFLDSLVSSNNGFYHFAAPSADGFDMNTTSRRELQQGKFHRKGKMALLPTAIRKRCQNASWKSFAGLLPELNYAYVTVDSTLFLWNYETGECKEYSRLGQVIISLALVKPKPGIFHEKIKYVIVLATPVEIVMLGCVFDDDNVNGEISIFETQFYVPSDNTPILKIVGTQGGRIFLCGKDGCVYELAYQARDGWFTRKVRKLNHSYSKLRSFLPSFLFGGSDDPVLDILIDETRSPKLLFSFSKSLKTSSHKISVWSLGENGEDMVLKTSVQNIASSVQQHVINTPPEKDFKIIHLATLSRSESENIVLVAVTNRGFRVYFELDISIYGTHTLSVKFVRSCPPFVRPPEGEHQPKSFLPDYKGDFSPRAVQKAYYHNGVLLMADNRSDRGDTLIAVTQEFVKQTHSSHTTLLNEMVQSVGEYPRIHDIREKPVNFYLFGSPNNYASFLYARGYNLPLDGLREFAVQHVLPNRQFICLTIDGIQTYEKTWPVDELREILKKKSENINNSQALRHFFENYPVKEVCAMCLIISCSTPKHLQLVDKQSSYNQHNQHNNNDIDNEIFQTTEDTVQIKRLATHIFFEDGRTRNDNEVKSMINRHHIIQQKDFSGVHDGLALYMSRILRPFWNWSIAQNTGNENQPIMRLRFSREHFSILLNSLLSLQVFLDRNYQKFFNNKSSSSSDQQLFNDNNMNMDRSYMNNSLNMSIDNMDTQFKSAFQEEIESLKSLISFYNLCVEAVCLFSILSEQTKPNFTDIVENMRIEKEYIEEYQSICSDFKFYRFVTSELGKRVAKALISGMLNPILDPQSKSDNAKMIIERLSTDCPSFFSASDRLHYQALEKLQRAQTSSPHHRNKIHNEALNLYFQSATNTEFNLETICRNLCDESFYRGAIKLSLERIKLIYSGEINIPNNSNNSSNGMYIDQIQPEQFKEQELRKCYKAITNTLATLIFSSDKKQSDPDDYVNNTNNTNISIVNASSNTTHNNEMNHNNIMISSDTERHLQRVIDLCLQSEYKQLHDVIYDWLIDNEQKERLFSLRYPSLIKFLTNRIREGYLSQSSFDGPTRDERMYTEILRKYYLHNEMWESATVLLDELSKRKSSNWTLSERILLLNEAYLCAKKCVDGVGLSNDTKTPRALGDIIDDLYDRIRLAQVQSDLFVNLQSLSSSSSSNQEKIQITLEMLNNGLLDIDKLYNFATEFHMFECCLAILNLTPHKEKFQNVISVLWTNVIRYCIAQDKQHWGDAIKHKLNILCHLYRSTPSMFPLTVIVEQLEHSNVEHKHIYEPKWVMDTLLSRDGANIDPASVLFVYRNMEFPQEKDHKIARCWSIYYLLSSLAQSLFKNTTLGDHTQIPVRQKQRGLQVSMIWEVLNRAKTELSHGDEESRGLYNKFESLEETLYNIDS